jgi:hypothetical protein
MFYCLEWKTLPTYLVKIHLVFGRKVKMSFTIIFGRSFAECKDDVSKTFLPLVVSACRFRQYTLHYIFFETVTKTLPPIAENLVGAHILKRLENMYSFLVYYKDKEIILPKTKLPCTKHVSSKMSQLECYF